MVGSLDRKYKIYCFDIFDTLIKRKIDPEAGKKIWASELAAVLNTSQSAADVYGIRFEIEAELFSAHYDSDDNLEWKYTLYATFEYEYGVSSVCTNAYYVQNIYKGNWTFSNGAAYTSANRAIGTGRYVEKYLFITINTIEVSLTMTCDVFGNVTS